MTAPRRSSSTPSSQSYSICSLLRALWNEDYKAASASWPLLDVAVVRHRRNHIASAAFSALFGVMDARSHLRHDSFRCSSNTPSSQSYSICSLLRTLWSRDCKVVSALCLFLNIAVVRRRRNHIASAAFSALFGVGIARLYLLMSVSQYSSSTPSSQSFSICSLLRAL